MYDFFYEKLRMEKKVSKIYRKHNFCADLNSIKHEVG